MSLGTRLSRFFLTILAIVLIGFSLAIYLGQRWSLRHRADEQLTTALKALVASIEVEPDGVEWNPGEHKLEGFANDPRWRAYDNTGAVIDESPGFPSIDGDFAADYTRFETYDGQSLDWWVSSERVEIPPDAPPVDASPSNDSSDGDDIPEYPAVTVVVAMSEADVNSELQRTAALLAILSVVIWSAASIFGRSLIQRTLQPMTTMATAARTITAGSAERLPVADSDDEIAELGRAFNTLLDRLAAEFDRERRFTAEASHQLRTPVTALLGHLDVTLRRDRPAEEYREVLESAREQSDRLRRIVESLLAMARAESKPVSAEPFDLATWLPHYLRTWEGRTGPGELRLEVEGPALVSVNAELVGQVLEVLLENAIKYGPPDRPIDVRLAVQQRTAVIEVIDRGPGISDFDAADIFRPFHRGVDAVNRGIPGLGLGLSLASRIAQNLEARLTFDRMPQGGSRFQLSLPTT